MSQVLVVSTFEGGYQPITVATALTPLLDGGIDVTALDTYVDGVREELLAEPALVAIAIPLFDAVQSGVVLAQRVRELNPQAHITFFGQHATISHSRLAGVHGDSAINGEWEVPLLALARHLTDTSQSSLPGVFWPGVNEPIGAQRPFMPRDHFRLPTRHVLPPLYKYPQPQIDKLSDEPKIVGSTEVARGCHHRCLYCSVFAAYQGKVLLIPEDLVVEDVRQLVAGGMTHLTFIDADFFNAKRHGMKILRRLHAEFPQLTYDVTTRVDHILENREAIQEMDELGVVFVTSALEFPSEAVLDALDKQTSIEQIETALAFVRTHTNIKLNPTFIMFNPWIRLEDLATFTAFVERNDLEGIIDPIQYETRLNLYKGSPLLALPSVQALELIEEEFRYEWKHADPRVDTLYRDSLTPVQDGVFKRCCLKC
jgi:radical SAM superfamily enzyme YgiQ (UPF0313 family)